MVEDAIGDPTRIAQLLASEVTGLATGSMAAVEVVDADQSATPSEEGTEAYSVAVDGERAGQVVLYPDAAVLSVSAPEEWTPEATDREDLSVAVEADTARVRIETGAAVKPAVDVLRSLLAA